jgi:CRP-like cAMP-binding protein
MYGCPRTATVLATEQAVVWTFDRKRYRYFAIKEGEQHLKERYEFIKKVTVLQSLSRSKLIQLSEALEEEKFSDGEDVFNAGDDGSCMYVVRSGAVSGK